jgi:1,2-phenylacetyl-CoA epoxidase catalytic subunit
VVEGAVVTDTDHEETAYTIDESARSWSFGNPGTNVFDFDYTHGREQLLRLYDKGTRRQWVASDRIDWSVEIADFDNPLGAPDDGIALFGSPIWERMTERERGELRRHQVAWQFSNFLHGEQGALLCASKIVNAVPNIDAKFYAATQVIDEARHVEVFGRYLHEKLDLVYPLNTNLQSLLEDALSDSRWDMTYLAMQVLIEGLALAAFGTIRNTAQDPLARAINAYVMQDEARHVMFGRLVLRDYYPELTQAERDDREEFCVDACYRMRDRFLGEEISQRLGLPVDEARDWATNSEIQQQFRGYLFSRIVPIIKDIGLWGPKIRRAFGDMGVLAYADSDIDALAAEDETIAEELDRQRLATISATANLGSDEP